MSGMNPYEAPRAEYAPPGTAGLERANRGIFVLAAIGAGLASLYWAALTLLLWFAASSSSQTSFTQVVMPCVLVVLYAMRGWQLLQGNRAAAQRILWLHGIGGFFALVQIASGHGLMVVLQIVKVLIHVFGGITALFAWRSSSRW